MTTPNTTPGGEDLAMEIGAMWLELNQLTNPLLSATGDEQMKLLLDFIEKTHELNAMHIEDGGKPGGCEWVSREEAQAIENIQWSILGDTEGIKASNLSIEQKKKLLAIGAAYQVVGNNASMGFATPPITAEEAVEIYDEETGTTYADVGEWIEKIMGR